MAVFEEHTEQVNQLQREHQDFIDTQKTQILQLKDQIENLKKDNTETMNQINDDANDEIKQIEKKNTNSLNQVKEMGLRSKADL
jgi:DNA anti-recombination protein RmuC